MIPLEVLYSESDEEHDIWVVAFVVPVLNLLNTTPGRGMGKGMYRSTFS
jgi:hypothetical protein